MGFYCVVTLFGEVFVVRGLYVSSFYNQKINYLFIYFEVIRTKRPMYMIQSI